MAGELSPERLAQIKAMRFTTGLNAACGHFDTEVERELYTLAATCWNALQQVLPDHERLNRAHAAASEELAQWTGSLR
ncbi:hypothetical protein [Streptomyces sp. NPDC090026]|uniref:hypothetical protein n=1 Tax=Streptomyces sp. NPDC090026 TaxID=3365923 RepID=UPI00381DB91C